MTFSLYLPELQTLVFIDVLSVFAPLLNVLNRINLLSKAVALKVFAGLTPIVLLRHLEIV